MMEGKKSFIVHFDKRDMLEELLVGDDKSLSYERVGRLFMALCDFAEYGNTEIKLDLPTKIAYKSMTPQIQKDIAEYNKRCETNRANARKGGLAKANNRYRLLPMANDDKQSLAIVADTDTDTDTVTDSDTDISIGIRGTKRKRFSAPTLEEVKAYCLERENKVEAERFVDYYTSNGWKVGKNPMKDWKSAVRQWERNEYTQGGLTNERNNGNDSRRGEGENENGIGTCV